MNSKVCAKCKVEKDASCYYRRGKRLNSYCRDCESKIRKEKYTQTRRKKPLGFQPIEGEEWKDIRGWEGLYQVSNMGRVKSLIHGEKLHAFSIKDNGYCRVTFSRNWKNQDYYVHRLVAEAFVPNPLNLSEVNHKYGDKKDNRASELEWSNRVLNNLHAYRVLGRIRSGLNRNGSLNGRSKPVIAINLQTKEESRYESGNLAAKALNIVPSLIGDVLRGKQTKTHGYQFKFA